MVVELKVSQLKSNPELYSHAKVRLRGLMTFGKKLPQGYWLTLYDGTGYLLIWSTDTFEGYCTVEGSPYQDYLIAAKILKDEKPEQEFNMRSYDVPAEIVGVTGLLAALGVYTNILTLPDKLSGVLGLGRFIVPLAFFVLVLASHGFIAELDRVILRLKLHTELWKIYLPLVLFSIIAVFSAPTTTFTSNIDAIAGVTRSIGFASLSLLLVPLIHSYVLYENGVDQKRAIFFGLFNPLMFFLLLGIGIAVGGLL